MIRDPREVASGWSDARVRTLAELAITLAEAPWSLSRAHLERARVAGLTDDEVLHAVVLASFFGHLNRIADAVDIPLDYRVTHEVGRADPTQPAWPCAPIARSGRHALEISRRTATAMALADWRTYIFQRDTPLTRRQRTLIARWVAHWLGDGGISSPADLTANPLDDALRRLAEVVTLAPWQITTESFAPLRAEGFDDSALFDVCATASSAGVFSRIEVALSSLAT